MEAKPMKKVLGLQVGSKIRVFEVLEVVPSSNLQKGHNADETCRFEK